MKYENIKLKSFLVTLGLIFFISSTIVFGQEILLQKNQGNNKFDVDANNESPSLRNNHRDRRRDRRSDRRRGRRDRDRDRDRDKDNDGESETQERTVPTQFEIAAMGGVKIVVNKKGWYSVSASQLNNAGFDTTVDSSNWRLICNGKEIPMQVNLNGSIEFYGVGTDTIYTDSNTYYLINGNVTGLRVSRLQPSPVGQNTDPESYVDKVELKNRNTYANNILNGEIENWYVAILSSSVQTFDLATDNVASQGQASLEIKLNGLTNQSHLVDIKLNGNSVGMASFSNKNLHQESFNIPLSALNDGVNQVSLQSVAGGSDVNLIDSIAISYPKTFTAKDNKIHFTVPAGKTVSVGGFSTDDITVYEIEDDMAVNNSIVQSVQENQTYGFSLAATSNERKFYAFSGSQTEAPVEVKQNFTSTLNSSSNQAEFVIITPPQLSSYAQLLANRRNSQGLSTMVVTTDDIADEFGFGTVTAENIRAFLQKATNDWSVKPDYVLLFGDSSFDFRNYLNGDDRNMVPTKLIETFDMETSSDGWMVDFDDDGVENISIGRLPVANSTEAQKVYDKIVRYETTNTQDPKSAVLVADTYFEILNGALEDLLPNNVGSNRIERAYLSDPVMRQEILDNANQDPTVVSYLGHGTTNHWATGNLFGSTQVQTLTNQKLSFYMLMTCLNGYTLNAYGTSFAETLMLSDNGAIATWTSSGSTYASGQISMGQEVIDLIFPNGNQSPMKIGDIVRLAKQTSGDWDAKRTWQLMGDPTIVIQ